MRIALCSTIVPFVYGGGRNIIDWLEIMLEEHGHQVEKIFLPQADIPDLIHQQMMAFRWINLEAADRIICTRPLSYIIPHPHKIIWFIHHIRVFYDLWDSSYRGFPDDLKHRGIRDSLIQIDTKALNEAQTVFTNSKTVSARLSKFNNMSSEVLYPPLFQPERYFCNSYNNEIVYLSRLEHHKRQHLLIDAMEYVKTPVTLRFVGASSNSIYPSELMQKINHLGIGNKIILENRWCSEEEKVKILSNCLAVAYIPIDEDSYGYPCLEAFHSYKPILTTKDSGGVLELVQNGINGYVVEPDPRSLAEAMDLFFTDRMNTKIMGNNANKRLFELNISWDHVIDRLIS